MNRGKKLNRVELPAPTIDEDEEEDHESGVNTGNARTKHSSKAALVEHDNFTERVDQRDCLELHRDRVQKRHTTPSKVSSHVLTRNQLRLIERQSKVYEQADEAPVVNKIKRKRDIKANVKQLKPLNVAEEHNYPTIITRNGMKRLMKNGYPSTTANADEVLKFQEREFQSPKHQHFDEQIPRDSLELTRADMRRFCSRRHHTQVQPSSLKK